MADRAFPKTAFHGGVEVDRVFVTGQEAEFVFGRGTQILPTLGAEIWGMKETRIVFDGGEKWFEFGFRIDTELLGNSAAGWTDAGNYFRLDPQWSPDLENWSMGKFIPAPVPVIANGDGTWTYWSRAVHPIDSAVKSGALVLSSGAAYAADQPNLQGDSRNNPFTGLTVLGVSRALGGFPYAMPADASRMQSDLAAIFPGATVEAISNVIWRIIIPNITFSAFQQANMLAWPVYYVAGLFGPEAVNGSSLGGVFVNAAGVPIIPRAFARLKITRGTRYDPYL